MIIFPSHSVHITKVPERVLLCNREFTV